MDFSGKAQKLERRLARTLDAAIGELVGREEPAPLEMVHAVLDRAEREIQDIGRGRRVFPFNCVRLYVLASARDKGARARIDAVVAGPPSLAARLAGRLASHGCAAATVTTEVVYTRHAGPDWQDARFHIAFDRVAEPAVPAVTPAPEGRAVPRLKLTISKGTGAQRVFVFIGGRIDIGRRAEVVDQRQRLVRTNHVAFAEDGPGENQTVSRRHAHIELAAGDYRLWDDRSAHGTSIVRGGRTIRVAPGARGTKLAAGDEIVLGQARLRVAIE
jgi:hypothetical protein